MASEALILVDIQNDYFKGGAFPLPDMERAAARAAKVLAWARTSGTPVIHIRHEEKDPDTGFLLGGTPGSQIHQLVTPLPEEQVITKHFPNSFRDTALKAQLSSITKVLVLGAMSNMCIDATVRAAADLGFEVVVIEDACAASDLDFQGETFPATTVHACFMAALAAGYASIRTSEQIEQIEQIVHGNP